MSTQQIRTRAGRLQAKRLACALFVFALCLAAAPHGRASARQDAGQDEPITLKANLVNVDVAVVDKKGKFVTDLRADEFTVYEDGVRQTVEFFDPPRATAAAGTAVAAGAPPPPGGDPATIISLVLDTQTTEPANLVYVREGTLKYIRERITPADTVAVFTVAHGLQLVQTFTRDKQALLSAVERAYSTAAFSKTSERGDVAAGAQGPQSAPEAPPALGQGNTDPSAMRAAMLASRVFERFARLRSQLSQQQSRPVLAAVAALCDAQRPIPGKKTVVLFSQGFVASSIQDWQVQATIDLANRANVAVYVVDPSGVTASAPRSGSYVPSAPLEGVSAKVGSEDRIRAVGGENIFDNVRYEGSNREQDVLFRVSEGTGGKLVRGTNDIAAGLDRIDGEIRARYTLAYSSTNQNFDGGFRKLKVEVRRPDVRVVARPGYNAIAPEEAAVILSPEERRLLEGFAAAEARPALPLSVELSSFRSYEGRYIVPVAFEVPPEAVRFEKKGEEHRMHLDVLGVLRNAAGEIISRLGGNFDVKMTDEQHQAIVANKIFYRQDVELDPGSYAVELIVRDRLSNKTAARRVTIALPVAGPEFSASDLVLSRHAELAIKEIGGAEPVDVFAAEGIRIRPSPAREFRAADNLIIFSKLYNAAPDPATGKPVVRVTVLLARDNRLAMKPVSYEVTEVAAEPVAHLTFAKYVPLEGLPAGSYTVTIEARDLVAHKLVKRQSSFVVGQ